MKKIFSMLLLAIMMCLAGTVRAEQLNEGFEGTTFAPEGWTTIHVSGNKSWNRYTSSYSNVGHESKSCAQIEYVSGGHENYLVTPQLRPQEGEKLTFYTGQKFDGSTTVTVEVSTTTAEASAFTKTLFTYVDAGGTTSTWAEQEIDLTDYVGQNIYIAFHAVDNYGFTFYLDDVSGVTLKPESCPKTGEPAATAKTTTTATIEWTENGSATAWNLQYKKASETDWSASIPVETTPSYELTGLASGTTYNVRVQANCGEETSDWKEGEAFDTECGTATLPFEPTFANGVKPNCWTIADDAWGSAWSGRWYTYLVSGTTYGLQYQASSSSAGATVQTPNIDLSEAAILTFKFTNYYSGRRVTSSVIISDGTTEETVALADATSASLEDRTIDLTNVNGTDFTGKSVKITFKGTKHSSSSGTGYLKIANIRVDVKPCPVPGVPAASEITATSAVLTWAKAESVEDYQFCCVRKGEAPVFGAAEKLLTVTLDTLQADTEYDFYVRTDCGADQSEAKSVSFETPKACSVPTDFVADNIQAHSAQFTWTSSASAFKFRFKAEGDESYSAEYDLESGSILNGLQPTTTYYAQVKAVCGTDDESDWTEAISFTTTCPASVNAPIAWTFENQTANATPKCWEIGGTSETLTSNPAYFWGVYSYSSNKSLRMYNYGVTAGTAFINTPAIVLSDKAQELVFDYSHKANCGAFTVKISKDNGANWTDLQSFDESGSTDSSNPGEFTEATISLADFVGETVILQFFATANWSQGAIYVDNIDIHDAPSCPAPANLQVSNIKANTATFSWESEATKFEYQYKYASLSIYKGDETTGKMLILNNQFDENVTYDFRVRAICGEGDTSAWAATQFTTACAVKTLPFAEGFESSTTIPACWEANAQWSIDTYEHTGTGSTQSVSFKANEAGDLVSPEIKLTDKASLTFDYKKGTATGAVYMVKGEEQFLITNLQSTSENWSRVNSSLKDANVGDTIRILFRGNQASSGSPKIYIDNIKIDYAPVTAPTNVTADPKDGSAIITWESSDEAVSWNLQYREVGTTDWTAATGTIVSPFTLTGLTNGTEYEIQVQSVVNENRISNWSTSANVTPANCPTVETVSFGAVTYNSVVVNWTVSTDGTWDLRYQKADLGWSEPITNISATTYTLTNLETEVPYSVEVKPSCSDTWVAAAEPITLVYTAPVATVNDITDHNAVISWSAVADADSYLFYCIAKVLDNDFDWSKAVAVDKTSTTQGSLDPNAEYNVHVGAVYGDGHVEAADIVSFKAITIAPENLAVSEVTATSAKLTWEFDGYASLTKFDYALGDDPDALVWTKVADASVELTELTPNTSYMFYVRTHYANNEISDSIKLSFYTECAAFTIPFTQDFNGVTALADTCWNADSWTLNTSKGVDGSKCARLDCGTYPATTKELASPVIALDVDAILKFWFKNAKGGEFRVLVDYGVADRDTLVKNLTGASAWTLQEIDLSAYNGKNVQLFFVGTTNGLDAEILLDDISVTEKPSCLKPTDLKASLETFEGATFSWTANSGETTWNLRYKAGEAEWDTIAVANPQALYNLTPDTEYTIQVQATCDETHASEWSDAITFTPKYLAPTNVTLIEVGTDTATIGWTANSGEGTWVLQYAVAGTEIWSGFDVDTNPYVLRYLTPGTTYNVRIIAGGYATSDVISITTECATIAALPYAENFEGFVANAVPNCWAVKNANDASHAIIVAGESMFVTTDGNALIFKGNYNQDTAFALLPEFSADLSNAQISFTHVGEKDGMGKLAFGYFVGEDFTSLLALDAVKTAVTIDPFVLPALPEGAHLAFAFKMNNTDDYNYYLAIDNILIEEKPECAVPTNVQVLSVTSHSAEISFNSEAEHYNYMIRKKGVETWDGGAVAITTSTFTIDELEPNTAYEVTVQAVCDGTSTPSLWTEEVEFTTDCAAETMPFYEGFEGGVPECWSAEGTWKTDEYTAHEGKSIRFDAKNHSGSLSTPKIEITEEDAVLIYYFRNTYGGSNHVGGSVTIKAGSQVLDSAFVDTKGENLERREISLADFAHLNVTITFNVQSVNASASVFIDSVRVVAKPCATPKNVHVEPGDGSAIVTWEPSEEEETAWKLSWGEKESMSWTGNFDPVTETTFEITGLENGVEYGVQVQSYCDATHASSFTEVVYFTPSAPTGMENINAKDNAVKFVENGVLYILRDGVLYNAQGAKVNR